MNFDEASRQYEALKSRLEKNEISEDEFQQLVGQIVADAPDGKKWMIDSQTGNWVEWVEGKSPLSPVKSAAAPGNMLQLLVFLAKGLRDNVPRLIMVGLLMAVLTWVSHTYLIAKVNDGLMYQAGKVTVNSMVHLQETHFPGINAFWGLLAYFLSSFFMRARALGVKNWFKNIKNLPKNIKDTVERNRENSVRILVSGAFTALLLGFLYRNFMLSWVLAFGILLIMTAHLASLEILVLRVGLLDIQKLFRRKFVTEGEEYHTIFLFLAGSFAGFILAGIWRTQFFLTLISALLLLALYIYMSTKGFPRMAAFFILVCGGVLSLEVPVFAWCEGASLSQVGGNWFEWWGSRNADVVRRLGLIPAGFSFAGGVLGSAVALLTQSFPSILDLFDPSSEESPFAGESFSDESLASLIQQFAMESAWFGGPGENPFTVFDGGRGPGMCTPMGLPNYWVSTANLGLVIQDTIFSYRGLGPEMQFTLTYNPYPAGYGMFGRSFSFSYDMMIKQNNQDVELCKGSGQRLMFRLPSSPETAGAHQPLTAAAQNHGHGELLQCLGDHYLLTDKKTHQVFRFDQVAGTSFFRLVRISDFNSNTVSINFNQEGSISGVEDAAGRVATFTYNGEKLCSTMTAPDGREASFYYDPNGNLIKTVDFLGVETEYQYDSEHYIAEMTVGRERRTTRFTWQSHESSKYITDVLDAAGNRTQYQLLSREPWTVQVKDPRGNSCTYQSDNGLTTKVEDSHGYAASTAYQNGWPVSYRDAGGSLCRLEYDSSGSLTRYIDAKKHASRFEYDIHGNLSCRTSPLGEKWSYTYDQSNHLTRIVSPTGRSMSMKYNQLGQLTDLTTTGGRECSLQYDRFGNLVSTADADGTLWKTSYDEHGFFPVAFTDALGNTTKFDYDENGRMTLLTNPDGTTRSFVYDCCAGILTTDEAGHSSAYQRDPLLNVTGFTDPLQHTTGFGYDENGRLTVMTDALGRSTTFHYDDRGRSIQIKDAEGRASQFMYSPGGTLTAVMDQQGNKTALDYDENQLLLKITDPLGHQVNYQRDAAGRISEKINARGEKISYGYNQEGQITSLLYDEEKFASFSYESSGSLKWMEDSTGATEYRYNRRGHLEEIKYASGLQVSFINDAVGNLRQITYPGGLELRYDYDPCGRVKGMWWNGNQVEFSYDPAGRLTGIKRSNHTDSSFSYDESGRLISTLHRKEGEPFVNLDYRRDAVGNIMEQSGTLPLAAALTRQENGGDYNSLNQLVRKNGESYQYDEDGNLISMQGSRKMNAAYDPENRLVSIERENGKTAYTYNGLGQRVKTACGEDVRNYYYTPEGLLLFETDGAGRITCYLYREGRLVAAVSPDTGSLFYHFDHNGSTLAVTRQSGETACAYDYAPFGSIEGSRETALNSFKFVGELGVMDEGNGIYFMTYRYYDAETGRFMQKDPLGFMDGLNLYMYAGNNPVNRVDPSGLLVVEIAIAALILVPPLAAGYTLANQYSDGYPTFNRAVSGANDYIKELRTNVSGARQRWDNNLLEMGDIQSRGRRDIGQFLQRLGDKAASTVNPVFSRGYSTIKGIAQAAQDDWLGAFRSWMGAIPGWIGDAWTAGSELWDAYWSSQGDCDPP